METEVRDLLYGVVKRADVSDTSMRGIVTREVMPVRYPADACRQIEEIVQKRQRALSSPFTEVPHGL